MSNGWRYSAAMKDGWRYLAAMKDGCRYLDEVLRYGWRRLRLEAVGRGRRRLRL